jgi:predicted phosphate transport protein (TIGR00153 family)
MTQTMIDAVGQPHIPGDLWQRVKEMERAADAVVREILAKLESSFVTPIEREDIHLLAVTIDDVADAITAAASRLDMFGITEPTDQLRAMCKALDELVEHVVSAVRELRTLKPQIIRPLTDRVDQLEEQIDELYRNTLRSLFERHPEAYDLVRWKEVYDHLESAADHGRHVARTVSHIVVRHS